MPWYNVPGEPGLMLVAIKRLSTLSGPAAIRAVLLAARVVRLMWRQSGQTRFTRHMHVQDDAQ
jgi:hypothetical protein